MKIIYTTTKEKVKVSDNWYDYLCQFTWYYSKEYATRYVKGSSNISMHREIMGFPENVIDHIDGDKLNNQIENLRIATISQNIANSKISKNNKCGYKGVYKGNSGWRACIMKDGKTIHLGTFKDIEDAVEAYDTKAIELFGEFARTNKLHK